MSTDKFLKSYLRESANLMRAKAELPEYLLMARAETGLYATLHRLQAGGHTSRIVRRHLSPPDGTLSKNPYE